MSKRSLLFVCCLLIAVSLALGTGALFAATAGGQENVSNTGGQSEGPEAAAFGSSLKVVWGERDENAVYTKEKTVGGAWPAPAVFGEGTRAQYQWPDIAVTPDGTTHVAYAAGDTIYHRSKPAGGGWSGTHFIANDNFPNPVRLAAAPNGTLWVVWRDTDGTAIRFARSTNGGNNWASGEVASQAGNMSMPDVAVGPDNVPHVVWYLRQSADNQGTARFADWNGSGWTVGSIGGGGGYVADPVIVVGSNNVQHVAYRRQSGDNWIIQHAARAPGQGWGQEDVRTTPGDAQYAPGLAVDQRGGIHVTWSELTGSGGRDVFYSVKIGGGGYSAPLNISENPGGWNSRSTVVVTEGASGPIAHVFYQRGQRGADVDEIFYRMVSDVGVPTGPAPTTGACSPSTSTPANLPNRIYLPLVMKGGC